MSSSIGFPIDAICDVEDVPLVPPCGDNGAAAPRGFTLEVVVPQAIRS